MTLYGVDCSHYDNERGGAHSLNMQGIKDAGIDFVSFKATEGTTFKDAYLKDNLNRSKAAGFLFIGAYMVPRTPGNNGNGSIAAQVDYFKNYIDSVCPWFFDFEGAYCQVDTEIWTRNGVVYDHVSAANGELAADGIRDKTPLTPLHYISKGQYGSQPPGNTTLWNANYPSVTSTNYKTRYSQAGGASGPGWTTYGTPARKNKLWQYGGGAVTIGTEHNLDINAFEGTEADFAEMIGADMTFTASDLDEMVHTDNVVRNAPWKSDAPEQGGTNKQTTLENCLLDMSGQANKANTQSASAVAAIAAANKKLDALTAAITALAAGGTNVDTATIIAAVNTAAQATHDQVAALQADLDASQAEVARLNQALAAAYAA